MSETCFRIRYPPYAGPLHLTDFQRTTLALGLCICSYGLAKAILTVTWHLEKNCSSSRNSEADNIGPFVVLCIIVLLQNCTVALRFNNAALSNIFHYMCMCMCCAHMRLFAAHWCVAIGNVHAQIYCNLNPPRILLSACIAICVSVPAPYIPWIGFLWLRMHCHWDFNAGHWLQQQTRGGTSSTLHPQDTPFICLLCFILVPSIFCSSPNQIHPPPFLLTAQQHILCSFQARHIAQLMTNNLHIRICFTCLLDFSPFPKPAPQPSHHLGPERRRR